MPTCVIGQRQGGGHRKRSKLPAGAVSRPGRGGSAGGAHTGHPLARHPAQKATAFRHVRPGVEWCVMPT